jgi:hypothetical protein
MLEIKCPFRRRITGEVPLQYYYQIQGQLECEFSKYFNEAEYWGDDLGGVDHHRFTLHYITLHYITLHYITLLV